MKNRSLLREMLAFVFARKVYWLLPAIILLLVLMAFIIIGASPAAMFIYPMI